MIERDDRTVAVMKRTGASYKQLDHWCRSGYIPGQEVGPGSGYSRHFTEEQEEIIGKLVWVSDLIFSKNPGRVGNIRPLPELAADLYDLLLSSPRRPSIDAIDVDGR